MPQPWPIPAEFNGAKFATRYALTHNDFFVASGLLSLRPPTTIPDDPPIFDLNDTPIFVSREEAKRSMSETREGQVIRALAAVMLSEINLLRAAVIPALPARTLAQLKTAIVNRIDDGTAD